MHGGITCIRDLPGAGGEAVKGLLNMLKKLEFDHYKNKVFRRNYIYAILMDVWYAGVRAGRVNGKFKTKCATVRAAERKIKDFIMDQLYLNEQ